MNIPEALVDEVRRGRAVLFLGSGASKGATLPDGGEPPDGEQLAKLIKTRFLGGDFPDLPLGNIAEIAINEAGLSTVQEYVAEQLQDLKPAPFHLLPAKFVWYGVATTNYDLLLEEAYRLAPSPFQELVPVSTIGKPVDDIARSGQQLVYLKLHGCLTVTGDPASPLVLTSDQVLTHRAKRERLYRTLIEWGHNHPIVFVGHSVQDADLRLLLQELDGLEDYRPSYYLVAPGVEDAVARYWGSRRVTVIDGSFDEFLTTLNAEIPEPARGLSTRVERDQPIWRRLVSPDDLDDAAQEALDTDLEYVHAGVAAQAGDPRQFYRGFDLGWYPIQQEWDVRRKLADTLLSEVILADEGDRTSKMELIVVKAEAGAGKSLLLRRLAWDAAVAFDALCLRLTRHGRLNYRNLSSIYRATRERIFLFVDSAADRSDSLRYVMEQAQKEGLPLSVITAERINEWNMGCKALEPFVTEEYPLRYLSRAEIEELIQLLDEHNSLYHLKDATHEERVEAFEKRAGRQLLVALHEATLGIPFEDILIDEYNAIRPRRAQSLYLTVCVLNRLGVAVRAGLISRTHKIPFEEFKDRLHEPLAHVVAARMESRSNDYVYRARHPYIAQIVFERILTDEGDRFAEYSRLLNYMNLSYSSDQAAFRQMTKGRSLLELFPNHGAVEELFDLAERLSPGDHAVLHQRGLYEMRRPNGNLRQAHDLLKAAQERSPRDSSVRHSLAELALVRSQQAESAFEREKFREEAIALATALLKDDRSAMHARHTLAKALIQELEEALSGEGAGRVDALIREIESAIDKGLAEEPGDAYLSSAEADFKKLLEDHEGGKAALEEAFSYNRRDTYIAARLAKIHLAAEEWDQAEEVLTEALEASPADKRLNYLFAKVRMSRGESDPEKLLYYLRRSFTEWDENYDAQFWYARYAYESDDEGIRERSSSAFEQLGRARVSYDERTRIRSYLTDGGRRRVFRGTVAKREDTYAFVTLDGMPEDVFCYHGASPEANWEELQRGDRCALQIGFTYRGPVGVNVEKLT